VSVLRRSPAGDFSLVQFPNDFIGWRTEEIYRKVFEIENPDAAFTRLDAMRPFKGKLREEADALARQPARSADEERSLQGLEEKILHIENVEQTRAKHLTQEEVERENKTLRDRLKGSASTHAAATKAQLEVDRLRTTLEAERQAARNRLILATITAAAIAAAVSVAAIGTFGRLLG